MRLEPERVDAFLMHHPKAGASISTQAVLLLIFGPQLEADRYPYPALKKNRAMKTITAITAIQVIII